MAACSKSLTRRSPNHVQQRSLAHLQFLGTFLHLLPFSQPSPSSPSQELAPCRDVVAACISSLPSIQPSSDQPSPLASLSSLPPPPPPIRSWRHAEMWWPRLLEGHPDTSWDDYEKDYSDLPPDILRRHAEGAARQREEEEEGGQEDAAS